MTSLVPVSTPQRLTAYATRIPLTFTGPTKAPRRQLVTWPRTYLVRVARAQPMTCPRVAYTRTRRSWAKVRAVAGPHGAWPGAGDGLGVDDAVEVGVDGLGVDGPDADAVDGLDGAEWAAEEPQAPSRTAAAARHVRRVTDRLECRQRLMACSIGARAPAGRGSNVRRR
jgi:hypothetical protein